MELSHALFIRKQQFKVLRTPIHLIYVCIPGVAAYEDTRDCRCWDSKQNMSCRRKSGGHLWEEMDWPHFKSGPTTNVKEGFKPKRHLFISYHRCCLSEFHQQFVFWQMKTCAVRSQKPITSELPQCYFYELENYHKM